MSSYTRNTKGEDFGTRHKSEKERDPAVAKEVRNLFKEGVTDYTVLNKLRAKHKDQEVADAIFDAYKEKLSYIMKKARKFKQVMLDRYGPRNLPFNELMKKAKKYQQKLKLNDDEFNMFVTLVYSEKSAQQDPMMSLPTTKMSKALGHGQTLPSASDKLTVGPDEVKYVQEILRMYGDTKTLHSQVVLQSLTYRDCSPEALTGKLSITGDHKLGEKYNYYSYVHPVVAALFLPRVNLLDEHMLISNIGYIVKCKYEGKMIMTKPDFEVYYDLIRDPNDNACSMDSAIKDLRNRYFLQTKLWDCVFNLRQGKYYNDRLSDFLTAIDNCRNNIYDAPDLTYIKDEGAILRRLLAAFSIRPTIVSTNRLWSMLGTNPQGPSSNPLSAAGFANVTTVPMITLRLPFAVSGMEGTKAVDIEEALSQPQWFVENKMIVPKAQQIIHSRDVLFFYVGRRFQSINISKLNTPYNFNVLPMTVAGWEQLNDMTVNFRDNITVLNEEYVLRSVVLIEASPTRRNLIVGSSAAIVVTPDPEAGRHDTSYLLYDPQGAGEMFKASNDEYVRNDPITYIPGHATLHGSGDSFHSRAACRGTIFMYQKRSNSFAMNQGTCNQ